MKNRLNLNFKLQTREERTQFLHEYLNSPTFAQRPPTSEELETMGDYLLWGKDQDGLNARESGDVELETRNKTWDPSTPLSLEGLIEQPDFMESILHPLNSTPPTKIKREVFSREEASKNPLLREALLPLWRTIDETELIINFYDLAHSKRTKPPRSELLAHFTDSEIESLREASTHLNMYTYLKRRHLLVELRREQYTIRDSFKGEPIQLRAPLLDTEPEVFSLEQSTNILPLGLTSSPLSSLIFRPFSELHPSSFTPNELAQISEFYWRKPIPYLLTIDFTNIDTVYSLYLNLQDLRDSTEDGHSPLLDTLSYYEREANLDDLQLDILTLKSRHYTNPDIAFFINNKYGKTYGANYISTIFRQKTITKICATAAQHKRIIENLPFEENFKQCTSCKKWYLISEENFIHRAISADGFANRCKQCDKEARKRNKR